MKKMQAYFVKEGAKTYDWNEMCAEFCAQDTFGELTDSQIAEMSDRDFARTVLKFYEGYSLVGIADDEPLTKQIDEAVCYFDDRGEKTVATAKKIDLVVDGKVRDFVDEFEEGGISMKLGQDHIALTFDDRVGNTTSERIGLTDELLRKMVKAES